jgi:ABC-type polysaccharide/polyol phosphate export permease
MFRIFNESITSGINSIQDFSGGLKSERVRTRVLIRSTIIFRVIDSSLQSLGVAIILLVGFNANPIGLVIYLISCQILGLVSEGFGLNLSLVVRKTPDISNIINYFLLLMFFGSPVLYPMTRMEGLHYKINEYNPLTYFIESSRYVLQLDSVLELLDPIIGVAIVVTVFLISVRGYFSVDKVRWEVSSWS